MFSFSEQLNNCYEVPVAWGSLPELNQPLISGIKKAGLGITGIKNKRYYFHIKSGFCYFNIIA